MKLIKLWNTLYLFKKGEKVTIFKNLGNKLEISPNSENKNVTPEMQDLLRESGYCI